MMVSYINASEGDPDEYRVRRWVEGSAFCLIEHLRTDQSFCVPVGCLLERIVEWYDAPKAAPAASRATDPTGLLTCKTPRDFQALGERLGMDEDTALDLFTSVRRAPNQGQAIMRGRNAIRNWQRKHAVLL
jgi:hypothetical protein